MDDEQERALVRRLVERLHLSVPERRALPGGRARLSLVVDAIGAIVRESGSFPANADPEGPFHGAMVLMMGKGFAVHWRYEVGVGRYDTARAQNFKRLEDAAAAAARSWEGGIDGVPIDETG
jgi:hypothetical protein